jgi:hypothetical protein
MRTQGVSPPAGEVARANLGQVIGGVGIQQFEQLAGTDGRQSQTHAQTLKMGHWLLHRLPHSRPYQPACEAAKCQRGESPFALPFHLPPHGRAAYAPE